jgi:hypothetical protein
MYLPSACWVGVMEGEQTLKEQERGEAMFETLKVCEKRG